ncbi:hypothetical protein JANAI62_00860 [Jannaschia pagri]|uniref:NIDO domain-containing protein n=1 Tax=Jannaschia pagri TaxID=2829797 RepID=A0ABQ4NGA1_9RHOB|nr:MULTISPECIES: nidogen-like domain-containing protein [unclassified Jannaschia]GIT90432.1 hypothetical protein JANAI61_08900 [Jannaschia sp. AI_61]GIT93463.1 hypothetical protein JANAI62_00860 [Jannaschia sp. AI_62]
MDLINTLGGPVGFGEQRGPGGDDDSSGPIDLTSVFPNGLDFFGRRYETIFINSNGNLTFDASFTEYNPRDIRTLDVAGLYPFWTDIDVSREAVGVSPGGTSRGTNQIWYDLDPQAGAFTVTWDDVRPYTEVTRGETNAFQIRLTAVPGSDGAFRVELRYEDIQWTYGIGEADTDTARIGFTVGDGAFFVELEASNQGDLLRALPDLPVPAFEFGPDGVVAVPTPGLINGTQGADELVGTDEADFFTRSGGADTIRPGLGADTMALGQGEMVIIGTPEDLFGDRLIGATWDDMLFVEGVSLTPDQISLDRDLGEVIFDLDGDGISDGSIDIGGPVRGLRGAFVTAVTDAGTAVGYVRLADGPISGMPVENPARFDATPIVDAFLTGDGNTDFRIRLSSNSEPPSDTALGVYEITPEGQILDVRILSPEVQPKITVNDRGEPRIPPDPRVNDVEEGHQLGLFLFRQDNGEELTQAQMDSFDFVGLNGDPADLEDRNYIFAAIDGEILPGVLTHAHPDVLNQDLQQHAIYSADPDVGGVLLSMDLGMFGGNGDFAEAIYSIERVAADVL